MTAAPSASRVEVRERGSLTVHDGCRTHRRSFDWIVGDDRRVILAMGTYDPVCLAARSRERTNDGAVTVWVPTGSPVIHRVGGASWKVGKGQYHVINADELNRPSPVSPSGLCRWVSVSAKPEWLHRLVVRMGGSGGVLNWRLEGGPRPMPPRLGRALDELQASLEGVSSLGRPALVESAATHFFELLVALHPHSARPSSEAPPGRRGDPRLAQAITFLEAQYYRSLSVDQLAEVASLSPRHLTTLFRREAGTSPALYLRAFRVQRAIERLQNEPHLTLEAVAEAVGYGDARALRAAFAAERKRSPSTYRS